MANKEIVKRSTLTGAAAVAGGAGAAAAVSAASLGATGLLGSIASVAGVTVVAATPIGWVIGAGALGAAAVGAGASLIGKKGVSEGNIKAHQQMNQDNQRKEAMKKRAQKSTSKIQQALALLEKLPNSSENQVFQSEATIGMNEGTMNPDEVIEICNQILQEIEGQNNDQRDTLIPLKTLVILYKYMMQVDGKTFNSEMKMYYKIMLQDFSCSQDEAYKLYREAPKIDDIDDFLNSVKEILKKESFNIVINNLNKLAQSDGYVDVQETGFMTKIYQLFNDSIVEPKSINLSDVKEWHLAQNNQQLGLYSLAEIDEKLANKELDSKDLLVWKDGMENWANANDVELIAQIIEKYKVATPPPLPTTPPPLPEMS